MSDSYAGQPDYVVVGYLSDLFAPWSNIEGSEWGEFMTALHQLLARCINVSDEERAIVLCRWFLDEMKRAFDEDWWGQLPVYEDLIWEAQDRYEEITATWRERAVGFKGSDALETMIAALPTWVRPSPDRVAKQDPEFLEYKRLKRKFEGTP